MSWLQAISGAYLAVSSRSRWGSAVGASLCTWTQTSTSRRQASCSPFPFFFAPYYSLAVVALFAHIGCAFYWRYSELKPQVAAVLLATAIFVG